MVALPPLKILEMKSKHKEVISKRVKPKQRWNLLILICMIDYTNLFSNSSMDGSRCCVHITLGLWTKTVILSS